MRCVFDVCIVVFDCCTEAWMSSDGLLHDSKSCDTDSACPYHVGVGESRSETSTSSHQGPLRLLQRVTRSLTESSHSSQPMEPRENPRIRKIHIWPHADWVGCPCGAKTMMTIRARPLRKPDEDVEGMLLNGLHTRKRACGHGMHCRKLQHVHKRVCYETWGHVQAH